MGLLCNCPLGQEISDVTAITCPEDIGQIQRIFLQRLKDSSGDRVVGPAVASAGTEAAWDALLTASDGTKVVMTPILAGPETEPGAAIEYGGGNATPGGIPVIVGREPTKLTCMILRAPQTVIAELKTLQCEQLQAYFVNQHGQIVSGDDDGTPANTRGFEIVNFFIGDKKFGGFEEPDANELIIWMKPNWSDELTQVITPSDFDPILK